MARLEGKLDTGLAQLTGAVNTLTQSIDNSDRARLAEAAEVHEHLADHESRLRDLDKDIGKLAARLAHMEAVSVTPKKLWGVVLGAIGGAAGLAAFINAISTASTN